MNLPFLNQNIEKIRWRINGRKRGSTVLLVLAMLSILLLLGIAFSYSTRLESQASFNYAELAQARTAAATGLPLSLPMIAKASQGLTSPLQDWNTIPPIMQKMVKANGKTSELSTREMAALRQAGMQVRQSKDGEIEKAPQANVQVRDLSGLVNINAVDDQASLERVVAAILPGTNAQRKASALMALRGDFPGARTDQGDWKARARQGLEEDEQDLDPRDPSAVMLDNLNRLRLEPNSGGALFTDAEIEKLAGMVTVFSQSPEIFNLPGAKQHVAKIPFEAVEPKLVYDTLVKAFPGKKNELLLQYAANIADFSDEDNEPTVLDGSGNVVETTNYGDAGIGQNTYTIGVEMTPLISEVYPDAATSVGFDDDGQFIEIVNPWNKSVSLAGWSLRGSNGLSVSLTHQLPANGYLVITDNYNTPKTDVPAAHGSVVSIFGATADGSVRQVMLQPGLNVADRNGSVSLHDPNGQLVDTFTYGATGQVDGRQSYQRTDPLVRGASYAEATPFHAAPMGAANAQIMAAATKAWEDGNTTLTEISQLFGISTGFVERSTADAMNSTGRVHAGQLAELKVPEGATDEGNSNISNPTDPLPDNLDLRLIDIFTATPLPVAQALPEDDEDESLRNRQDVYKSFREQLDRMRERADDGDGEDDAVTTVPTVFSYGKLNLNTCSKYALLGLKLDSLGGANDRGLTGIIEQFEGHRLRQVQQGKAPFLNVSDFVQQFLPNLGRTNLELLDAVTDQVAVGSSSFEIVATNRLSPEEQKILEDEKNATGPRPATATARWVISTDQEPYSIISFTVAP